MQVNEPIGEKTATSVRSPADSSAALVGSKFDKKLLAVLSLTIVASLAVRLLGFNFESHDYTVYLEPWYDFLVKHGPWHGQGEMTGEVSNYPPLYLYFLSLATLLPLPKLYSIKLISVTFDYVGAWYIWRLSKTLSPSAWRAWGAMTAFLFLPTVVLNGSIWSQCDVMYTTGLVASLYYVLKRRPVAALIAFGLSFALKPQAIYWCPLLAGLFVTRRLPWKWIWIPAAVYAVCGIPAALAGRPFFSVLMHWAHLKNSAPGLTLNAPNWYQWVPTDESKLLSNIGVAATLIATVILVRWMKRGPREGVDEPRWLLTMALFTVLFPPFLLPGMHERYFFAADVLSVVYAVYVTRGWRTAVLIQSASVLAYLPFLFSLEPVPFVILSVLTGAALAGVVKDLLRPRLSVSRQTFDLRGDLGRRVVMLLQSRRAIRWLLGYEALVLVGVLLVGCGVVPEWGRWYCPDTPHRLQTEAFLHGNLALSDTPAALATDLAWIRGGVHQVWGLGVPLWRLPFEAVAKLFGEPGFPDRLAFGTALVIAAFWISNLWLGPLLDSFQRRSNRTEANKDEPGSVVFSSTAISLSVLLLLFPPFVNWLRTPLTVYDEVLAYTYVYGLMLMAALIVLVRSPSWLKYWGLCALAGVGGLLRPTICAYGVVAVALATAWIASQRAQMSRVSERTSSSRVQPVTPTLLGFMKSWRLWTGLALFAAGGAVLFVTNELRYGDGTEFGHRVHVEGGSLLGTVYATRFGGPFENEPLPSAARELIGAVFFARKFNGFDWYRQGFFPGQSDTVRWRHFYSKTFDWTFAVLVPLGWGASIWSMVGMWRKRRTAALGGERQSIGEECIMIGFWSLLSAALIAAFYLRTCFISSRYIMDLAPAFAAGMLALALKAFAVLGGRRWTRYALLVMLAAWTAVEIASGNCMFGGPRSATWSEVAEMMSVPRMAVHLPESTYMAGFDFHTTGIPLNGEGWESDSTAAPAVILFVKDPEFVEIDIAFADQNTFGDTPPLVQAKIGSEVLKRRKDIKTSHGWQTTFQGPSHSETRRGIQTLFLGFGPKEQIAADLSPYRLLRVSWKPQPPPASEFGTPPM